MVASEWKSRKQRPMGFLDPHSSALCYEKEKEFLLHNVISDLRGRSEVFK